MLAKNEYYEIVVKGNNFVEVVKINGAKYNYFKNIFDDVYRMKNGKKFPLDKDSETGANILIVDDEQLYELMMDLAEKGFCDKAEACMALVRMEA